MKLKDVLFPPAKLPSGIANLHSGILIRWFPPGRHPIFDSVDASGLDGWRSWEIISDDGVELEYLSHVISSTRGLRLFKRLRWVCQNSFYSAISCPTSKSRHERGLLEPPCSLVFS